MNLEEDLDRYLEEYIYKFLRSLSFFLLISLFFSVLYFFLEGSQYKVLRVSIVFCVVYFLKKCFLKRDTALFSYILISIFLILSLYFSFLNGFLFHSLLLTAISFFLYLIVISNLDFTFFLFLFVITTVLVCNFLRIELGMQGNMIEHNGNNLFVQLFLYWLIVFFLYILFRGCFFLKAFQQKVLKDSENYRYLANMEYKNRLLGRISKYILHDISTPISVVSGYLRINPGEEIKEEKRKLIYKESVLASLLYIENILNDSLDVVKHQSDEKFFEPDSCILNMVRILKGRLCKSKIILRLKLPKNTKLKGNRCAFCRIFLNLFINSVEELELTRKSIKIIEVETYVLDNTYILSIKDNGRGFKKELLEKIDRNELILEEENLGLGLFFVFNSVREKFKGKVEIKSNRWRYTKIKVFFPL